MEISIWQITFLFLFIIPLVFLPTIIAFARGHKSRFGIFVLNFFLGWTFVFWVVSLAWALGKKD
ncbi:superinfection immunity protein [Helicobacter cholecystus]|uniref:superinfection immunity protein n=1 Tax=Helicobacter cholecystus TaxID=45498 RepID=UPI002739D78D|nr:superinfection immunity protein [Helicobacter cholecystus]